MRGHPSAENEVAVGYPRPLGWSYHNVDGPYLVTFCCLVPYTTQIRRVGISMRVLICMWRRQVQSEKISELISNCYEVLKFAESEP